MEELFSRQLKTGAMHRPGSWIHVHCMLYIYDCYLQVNLQCDLCIPLVFSLHHTKEQMSLSRLLNMTWPLFCQQQFFYSLHHSKTKFLVQPIHKTGPKSLLWVPHVYHGLRMHHDWPVKNPLVDLPNQVEGKFEKHFQ